MDSPTLKPFNVGLRVEVLRVDGVSAEAVKEVVTDWFYRVTEAGFGLPGSALPYAVVTSIEEAR